MDLPSRVDLFARGRAFVRGCAKKLDPKLIDLEGSQANIIVQTAAMIGAVIVSAIAFEASKLLIESAEKDDLDRIVFDRYRFTRHGASPSRTDIQLSRPTFAGGAGTIPVGTRVVAGNVEFLVQTPISFGPTDLFSQGRVRSTKAGSETRVARGAINRFARPGEIFDKTIEITNEEAAAGGEDRELDDAFRARARKFARALARGTLDAIETGGLSVPGVVQAVAIEVLAPLEGGTYRDLPSVVPARVVELFIADSTGVASRALATEVETALREWRAGGVAVLVRTSIPVVVPIVARVRYRANVDSVTLAAQMNAAIVAFTQGLAPNQTLYVSDLITVLKRYNDLGVIVDANCIVEPAGDLVPDVGQTIRATTETVQILA